MFGATGSMIGSVVLPLAVSPEGEAGPRAWARRFPDLRFQNPEQLTNEQGQA